VEYAQRGDEYALNAFYTAYSRKLIAFANTLLKNHQEAEDVVSETFLKLWQNRHKNFDSITAVFNFLKETTKNACLNVLKKKEREREKYKGAAYILDRLDEHQFDRAIIKPELLEAIDEMVENLPADCRDIFKMLWFDGKKATDIAKELNIEDHVVSRKKAKAIAFLKSAPFINKFLLPLYILYYMLFKK
jgi:RNA polymerase sigma-70 factor (family 1)